MGQKKPDGKKNERESKAGLGWSSEKRAGAPILPNALKKENRKCVPRKKNAAQQTRKGTTKKDLARNNKAKNKASGTSHAERKKTKRKLRAEETFGGKR